MARMQPGRSNAIMMRSTIRPFPLPSIRSILTQRYLNLNLNLNLMLAIAIAIAVVNINEKTNNEKPKEKTKRFPMDDVSNVPWTKSTVPFPSVSANSSSNGITSITSSCSSKITTTTTTTINTTVLWSPFMVVVD